MSLTTQYATGSYMRKVTAIKSQSIIEIRFSGQEISEAIAVYPQVCLSSCEISSGRANYGGRLVVTLVYADENGKLCRVQKGAEFTHFADDDCLAPANKGICKLTAERTQVKREGSNWLVAVVVSAEIEVFASAERSFITSAEGAVIKSETVKLYSAAVFSGESEVEDSFDCNAEDVLVPCADVLVDGCTLSAGVATVTGEIYLSLLAVRNSSPVSLDRVIPFKCEIAEEDALLVRKASCRAEIKDLSVTAKVNEERGKCGVDVTATLAFTGEYYEEEETPVIADLFSKTRALNVQYEKESCMVCGEIKVYPERVSGLCASKAKLDYTCAFLAAALPKAEYAVTDAGIEGGVTATLLYEQNGEMRSTEVNLPFSVTNNNFKNCKNITVSACAFNIRQRSEGECEAEVVLKISATECEEVNLCFVKDASEGEELKVCDSAMSVYIPNKGDGLWDTAKKLLQSPEEIETTNPELAFPLTGKERILVFRAEK